MKKLHILCFVCLLAAMQMLSSCGSSSSASQTITAADVSEQCTSGVVLIQNKFFYELDIEGFKPVYFSDFENGEVKGLTMNPNEIEPVIAWGTGFFIDENGHIATNAHVADPSVDAKGARGAIVSYLRETADEINKELNALTDKISIAQLALLGASGSDRMEIKQVYDALIEERETKQAFINNFHELSGADYEVKLVSELSIAYANTHVNKLTDFSDCVLFRSDRDHDLAIIQLKTQRTPEECFIFAVDDTIEGDEQDCPVGTQLFLIGYNHGPQLAITEEGLKPQVFQGAITQNTDSNQILYSIPTLGGSSGSPVLDEYGDLVAVNYAGLSGTQNFNYGIKIKHLVNLINK